MLHPLGQKGPVVGDTHTHTKASDGKFYPKDSVGYAYAKNLKFQAITDHDSVWGLDEGREEAERLRMDFIDGIELDARYVHTDGERCVDGIELIGLGIDPPDFYEHSKWRFQQRKRNMKQIIDRLNRYFESPGFDERNAKARYKLLWPSEIEFKDFVEWKIAGDSYENPYPLLTKYDLADFVMSRYCLKLDSNTPKFAFKGRDNHAGQFVYEYVDIFHGGDSAKPTFEQMIKLVGSSSDAVSVIAHPGVSKAYAVDSKGVLLPETGPTCEQPQRKADGRSALFPEWRLPDYEWYIPEEDTARRPAGHRLTPYHIIRRLAEEGLGGIESYYYRGNDPVFASEQDLINRYFERMARELGLLTTYGSDCHGPKDGGPHLGHFGWEDESVFNHIRKR